MEFLMDYLPAIQFAAAINIGYIIPTILEKVYGVLENIDASYLGIFDEVKSKVVLKKAEINRIEVVETKKDHSTQQAINSLCEELDILTAECNTKEEGVKKLIARFVGCSGYRSLFFYSALYSVMVLLMIPFCHQHKALWSFNLFLYTFSFISIVYLICLLFNVIIKKKDISCHLVLWRFIIFFLLSILFVFFNSFLPTLIVIGNLVESILSWLTIVIPFFPGMCCILFISSLIFYSICIAKKFAKLSEEKFDCISKGADKLNEFNKILNGDISLTKG